MKKVYFVSFFAALMLITGCSSNSSTSSSDMGMGVMPAPAAESMMDNKTVSDRAVIKTSSLSLRVDDVEKSIEKVTEIVDQFKGRIDDSSLYKNPGTDDSLSANLTIRVPNSELENSIEKLKTLGDVENSSISASDVTMQKVDLEARISSLESSISKFRELLASATNVTDLISAESALAERQAELDSLNAQLKYLSQQVDMSVIYLSLLPSDSFSAIKPIGFLSGLEKGFYALLNTVANLTSFVGYAIPWIGLIVLIILLYKIISRIRRN